MYLYIKLYQSNPKKGKKKVALCFLYIYLPHYMTHLTATPRILGPAPVMSSSRPPWAVGMVAWATAKPRICQKSKGNQVTIYKWAIRDIRYGLSQK